MPVNRKINGVTTVLSNKVNKLPQEPGIYKFIDAGNKILYIGKAKNLKKRVASYFSLKSSVTAKTCVMVNKIRDIDYMAVNSEYDALLLENNLIKKYQPRYNVNLKDGKSFPFICIKNEHFPRVFSTRNRIQDGSEYFGPYASVHLMNILLDLIKKIYPVRSCSFNLSQFNIKNKKFKVCLDYHIGLCKGPCEDLQTEEDYLQNIKQIKKILSGHIQEVIVLLKEQMQTASKNLDFEKASYIKEQILKLETFQAKSTIVNPKIKDVDVFSIYSNEKNAYVNYLKVIKGAIIQTHTIEYTKKLEENDKDLLMLAIAEIRNTLNSRAPEIIIPFKAGIKFDNVKFTSPKVGDKKKLLELSLKNAYYYARDKAMQATLNKPEKRTKALLEKVQNDLGLDQLPEHIECIDNSHLQGKQAVSSVVVFLNGKPDKKSYRLFNLKTVHKPDDYAAMFEVVLRRYKRLLEEKRGLPQLLIIDGGKGQLNIAVQQLKNLNLDQKIQVRGIAKRLEEIYAPGDPCPLHIDKTSSSLRLIQNLRNEAHRFAIQHHRKRRIKDTLANQLEIIPGIGKNTSQKLLKHFKSVKKISLAEKEEISQLIGNHKAEIVKKHL